MATRFELALEGERATGEAALTLIEACEQRYSLFRRDSLLARINREAASGPVKVDEETFELLATCLDLRDATGGAFDVCVEPSMRAQGFHPGEYGGERGTYELHERARTVRFTSAGTALDLGGIAKGHALDLAAACLREHGVERALLHGGTSSVVAIGAPPGERGWRVALGPEPDAPVAVLRDRALSVSAPRGRVVEHAGKLVGHVLDPRSGEPAALDRFAAVVHASARAAEAWSKALIVDGSRSMLARAPDAFAYFLRTADGAVLADPDSTTFELPTVPTR